MYNRSERVSIQNNSPVRSVSGADGLRHICFMNRLLRRFCPEGLRWLAAAAVVFVWGFCGFSVHASEAPLETLMEDGYLNHINRIAIDLPNVSGEYRYAVVNDSHMICLNEEVKEEDLELLGERRESFRSPGGYYSEETFRAVMGAVDRLDLDGVILNGDIVDEASAGNYSLAYNTLKKLDTPYMYLRADHDSEAYWTEPHEDRMSRIAGKLGLSAGVKVWETQDFTLVGLNDTTTAVTQQQLTAAGSHLKGKKPVILFSHVPYAPKADPDFSAFVKGVRGRLIFWGGDNSLYEQNAVMESWMDMVYRKDNPVKAVICGHIHGEYRGPLNGSITQYVCGPCFGGTLTILSVF